LPISRCALPKDGVQDNLTNTSWRHFDFWLLGAVAVVTIFGITMISSTIQGNIELAEHARRQFIFAVAGFVALLAVASIDYHMWSALHGTLYIGTFSALAILYTVATAVLGSARWFQTALVSIQPSEFAKIVMIMVLAGYFSKNMARIGEIQTIVRSFLLTIGIVIWIVLQPNLSTSIVILVIWFAMLWASGVRIRHLALFALVGLILVSVVLLVLPQLDALGIDNDYQLRRVQNFLAPDEDASYGDNYNVEQALISIGSGGWFGQGFRQGSQVRLRFLKVRWSDYIFSATANDFGFAGTLAVMLGMGFIIFRCLRAAYLSRDTFGGLICYGVATLLAFQAMVNMGVNLKLLPATGLPLPFLSYGGSSLFSLLLGVGLVESVILRHKDLEF
jgi:rod shape determining protein RodA